MALGNRMSWKLDCGRSRGWPFALCLLATAVAPKAFGQSAQDAEELRRRSQQEAEERLRQQQAPDVRLRRESPAADPDLLSLPSESPCFPIHTLSVDDGGEAAFAWAQSWLDRYAGQCIGRDGIELILRRLSAKLIA